MTTQKQWKKALERRIPASLKSVLGFMPDGPRPGFPPSTPPPVLGFIMPGELPVVPETGVTVPGVPVVGVVEELHKLTRGVP